MKSCRFIFILFSLALGGCVSRFHSDLISVNYTISYEEANGVVSCLLQFYDHHLGDRSIELEEPAKVEIDGKPLQPATARYNGAYYELVKPSDSFTGRHIIRFTNFDKKVYEEAFDFIPFGLSEELPEQINRDSFSLHVTGLPQRPVALRLEMIDTAYGNNDVHQMLSAVNGRITITKEMLHKLVNGPVNLQLYWEEERLLEQRPKNGGTIAFRYELKRDFILTD